LVTITQGFGQSTAEDYVWKETDTSLALLHKKKLLWKYNFNTQKGKPYFHPIRLNEKTITAHQPKDHPWHLGLWFSWKYINGVDYWEYDRTDDTIPDYQGITDIKNVQIVKRADHSCTLVLDIVYHEKDCPPVLTEKRVIEISAPEEDQTFYIDYTFTFNALEEQVTLDRTPLPEEENGKPWGGYAGLTLRFSTDFKTPLFLNADQSRASLHGKVSAWSYYGFKTEKGFTGVTIFDHPQNTQHPTSWHITDDSKEDLYVVQPAPLFQKSQTLQPAQTVILKYRVKFYNRKVSHTVLDNDWKAYGEE